MILEVSWDGLWTLSLGLSHFHAHSSWLVCEVALSTCNSNSGQKGVPSQTTSLNLSHTLLNWGSQTSLCLFLFCIIDPLATLLPHMESVETLDSPWKLKHKRTRPCPEWHPRIRSRPAPRFDHWSSDVLSNILVTRLWNHYFLFNSNSSSRLAKSPLQTCVRWDVWGKIGQKPSVSKS